MPWSDRRSTSAGPVLLSPSCTAPYATSSNFHAKGAYMPPIKLPMSFPCLRIMSWIVSECLDQSEGEALVFENCWIP